MNFTTEQIAKAKQAKSVEELLQIAKENGFEMTEEQAKQYFAELHREGELSDEELDSVVGGSKDPEPLFNVGDNAYPRNNTYNYVKIEDRELRSDGKWWYYVEFTTLALKGRKAWYAEESLVKM